MASEAGGRSGSRTSDAEMAAGRARDDFAGDLHKLSKDVAMIRDTVTEIARIVGSQMAEPTTHLSSDIVSTVKQKAVITMALAFLGAVLLLLSLIFGVEALHEWLKSRYGGLPAFVILCGAWALLGIVLLGIAVLLSKRGSRSSKGQGANSQSPDADNRCRCSGSRVNECL